jgi:hypothetical protein
VALGDGSRRLAGAATPWWRRVRRWERAASAAGRRWRPCGEGWLAGLAALGLLLGLSALGALASPVAAGRILAVNEGAADPAAPASGSHQRAAPLLQLVPTPTRAAAAPVPAAGPVLPLWGQNPEPATLWAGADPDADEFTTVPPGAYFRILGTGESRYRVYYGGDRARRRPGEAWIDKEALTPADWPQFVRLGDNAVVRAEPRATAPAAGTLARGVYVEVLQVRDGWARALYLGDGRDAGPLVGWVPSDALLPTDVAPARIARFLATAEVLRRRPEVWLKVPYISQLDGSPWAAANCGPTSVAMLLAAHGFQVSPAEVRRQVMALQRTPNCHDCGSFIEALAGATEAFGLRALDLQGPDGKLRRWSADDLRAALRASRPVVPQVKFRLLPGREDAAYGGDHYIVLTGIVGDAFLYNDPIDDGPGYGRVIGAEQLQRAMAASDSPYAAFAATLPQ